jgi:hypothetical protein
MPTRLSRTSLYIALLLWAFYIGGYNLATTLILKARFVWYLLALNYMMPLILLNHHFLFLAYFLNKVKQPKSWEILIYWRIERLLPPERRKRKRSGETFICFIVYIFYFSLRLILSSFWRCFWGFFFMIAKFISLHNCEVERVWQTYCHLPILEFKQDCQGQMGWWLAITLIIFLSLSCLSPFLFYFRFGLLLRL